MLVVVAAAALSLGRSLSVAGRCVPTGAAARIDVHDAFYVSVGYCKARGCQGLWGGGATQAAGSNADDTQDRSGRAVT